MATSGSSDFNLNRNQILRAILRKIGVLAEGQTPSAADMADAAEIVNVMIKAWTSKGINLWKYVDIVVFIDPTTQRYLLGPTGDHAATDYVKTELAADALAGAGTITVESDEDISSADKIGIVLDDGTLQWTTVNGAPAANVITLGSVLTGAASSGAFVYAYTNKTQRPLRITAARLKVNGGNEVPVQTISRQSYYNIPNKTSSDKISQVYYDPQLGNGVLNVWRRNASVNDTLHLTAHVPIQDFDAALDEPDLPQEWLEAIIYNGAKRVATDYGISLSDPSGVGPDIVMMAQETLDEAMGFDREIVSVRLMPSDEDDAESE